jgi:hypothetical protein
MSQKLLVMETTESLSVQVQQFENFCVEKRALEGGIEVALAKRDASAAMDVTVAERELESIQQECEEISERVTRARHGDFNVIQKHLPPSPNVFTTSSAPAQPHTRILNDQHLADATEAPLNTPIPNKHIPPANQGPPTPSGFRRSHSFDTALKQPSSPEAQADSQKDTHTNQRVEDDLSDKFLNHLVQRHTELCRERQILQVQIEGRLEGKKRLATEKLGRARVQLEKTRRKAKEVVEELKKASGGDTRIRLPTGAPGEVRLGSPSGLTSDNAGASSLSHDAPPPVSLAAAPTVAAPIPHNTFSKGAEATAVVGSALSPSPSTPGIATVNRIEDLLLEFRRPPTATPSQPPPNPPSNITELQQAIFRKYDEMMPAAKAAGANVPITKIPWPLLVSNAHQYPMKIVMRKTLEKSSVSCFIELYARWKGWNLRDNGRPMRADWERLLSVLPDRRLGGSSCAKKVVSVLQSLIPDK